MPRVRTGNLPPQRKKTNDGSIPSQGIIVSKKKYNSIDASLIGKYIDQEKRRYDVIRSYCKHKDGIDEWLEWSPDIGPFRNRVFMPLDEEVLKKKVESGELTKVS